MKQIEIKTDNSFSKVLIGESFRNVSGYLPDGKVVIITDENVARLYGNDFPPFPVITIGMGEKNKTIRTLEHIFDNLLKCEADRSTFILGIGGGIVCDVAGFAASVYMRGLRFGFVSTTLLSQVDASVGGKNGVNFNNFKNMIGVFRQPEFVICDTGMLATLKPSQISEGFAEIVKAAIIRDASFFTWLNDHNHEALALDNEVITQAIYRSVSIKAAVVQNDELEKGERKILNLGHSFAHTIENLTGISHGEAVSIGIVLASRLSEKMGLLSSHESESIRTLLEKFNLAVSLRVNMSDVIKTMKKDKEREGDMIHLVLPDRIGHAVIKATHYKTLEELIYDLR